MGVGLGLTVDREVLRLRDMLSAKFADYCYNGFWFSPEMEFHFECRGKKPGARHWLRQDAPFQGKRFHRWSSEPLVAV